MFAFYSISHEISQLLKNENYFQWYRQNRELKRRSQIITQKLLQSNPDGSLDLEIPDEVDSNFEDLDQLRETVKGTNAGFIVSPLIMQGTYESG